MKNKSVYAVHHLCHLLGDSVTDLFASEADARALFLDLTTQVSESLNDIEILVHDANELYYSDESSGVYIRIVLEEMKVK